MRIETAAAERRRINGEVDCMNNHLTHARHGRRKALGLLAMVNGKRALAYVSKEGEKPQGYSYLDEINDEFCRREEEIPKYDLEE